MLQHTVQTPYMVGEVHFYSAELHGGLALFDTGPPTREGQAKLLDSIDLAHLDYLFITHCHVDHYGLTNFIFQNSNAVVYMPRADAVKFSRHAERMAGIAVLLTGYGFSDEFICQLRESLERHKIFPVTPEKYRIIEESAELDGLGVNWLSCPGHSQGDLVYLLGDCAVTGDTLLRNIFQAPLLDMDLESFSGRFRNYDRYCASLLKLTQLRGYRIMPGHRQYIKTVDEAILFYVTTLFERAVQVLPFRHLPLTEIIERLFLGRMTDPFFVYLKISEVVFMLDFIENPSLLKASLEQAGLFDRVERLFAAAARS